VTEERRRKLLDNLPTIAKFLEPFDKACTNFREKKLMPSQNFACLLGDLKQAP